MIVLICGMGWVNIVMIWVAAVFYGAALLVGGVGLGRVAGRIGVGLAWRWLEMGVGFGWLWDP